MSKKYILVKEQTYFTSYTGKRSSGVLKDAVKSILDKS